MVQQIMLAHIAMKTSAFRPLSNRFQSPPYRYGLPGFRLAIRMRQHGVVLFFALIALVVMSLAAVALIRSVDTSTLIAGNLAFRQAAVNSGDRGIDSAVTALAAMQATMTANNIPVSPDIGCPATCASSFNTDAPANGYYSSINPALNLGSSGTWTNANSMLVGTDNAGNEVRYIIQRMCRTANSAATPGNCLFSTATVFNSSMGIARTNDVCENGICVPAGSTPQIRITSRTRGPNLTVSYVQAIVN
jgi:Tfp pilus assembly protein PilX